MPSRVAPVTPGTRPELAELEARITAERGRLSPLYQMLLNSVPLADGWERLLTAVRNQSSVPPRLRELAILRVAVLNRAPFEFDAHVPHALAAGLTREKIDALRNDTIDEGFDAIERVVVDLTDAMTHQVQVADEVFDRLHPHFDARATVELVATVAAYNMVSRFLEALEIGH